MEPGAAVDRGRKNDAVGDPREAWRRERRVVARLHHPDLGGDPEEYVRQLSEVDHRHGYGRGSTVGLGAVSTERGVRVTLRRKRRRVQRRLRSLVRAARGRLPRGVPGRRRYTSL